MNLRLYRAGAWLWIITGVVHNIGDVLSRMFPPAAKEPIRATLRELPFEVFGMKSNYYSLTMGFSLAMGTSIALAGVLFLITANMSTGVADRVRPACLAGIVASLVLLFLAIAVLQLLPPIVTFTLASVAFSAAVLQR